LFKREPANGEIVDAALHRCRALGLRPSKIADPSGPLVKTVEWILDRGYDPQTSPLAKYYRRVKPTTAAGVLKLPGSHKLHLYPPLGAVFPWFFCGPQETYDAMKIGVLGHYQQNNQGDWNLDDGHSQYGPVSERKVEFEIDRFEQLTHSILNEGVWEDMPPLLGNILFDDENDEWVCCIKDGMHRVAVFAALGKVTHCPVRVLAVQNPIMVRRSLSCTWPLVVSGLFTEKRALRIFDSYVSGE
jgi:hypothetical protein